MIACRHSACPGLFKGFKGEREHWQTIHTDRVIKCAHCDKIFVHRSGLSKHVRKYHPNDDASGSTFASEREQPVSSAVASSVAVPVDVENVSDQSGKYF